jgi:hypothetical protein
VPGASWSPGRDGGLLARLRTLLEQAGRSRGIGAEAERLRQVFTAPQMRQLPRVRKTMAGMRSRC